MRQQGPPSVCPSRRSSARHTLPAGTLHLRALHRPSVQQPSCPYKPTVASGVQPKVQKSAWGRPDELGGLPNAEAPGLRPNQLAHNIKGIRPRGLRVGHTQSPPLTQPEPRRACAWQPGIGTSDAPAADRGLWQARPLRPAAQRTRSGESRPPPRPMAQSPASECTPLSVEPRQQAARNALAPCRRPTAAAPAPLPGPPAPACCPAHLAHHPHAYNLQGVGD